MNSAGEGHSVFSNFSYPFKFIPFKRLSDEPLRQKEILRKFEVSLCEQLTQLQNRPTTKGKVINLEWMCQALEVLYCVHKNLNSLVTDLHFPVKQWEQKWMDEYLEESLNVLDICIAINSEISRMEQTQLLGQYVLHVCESSEDTGSVDKQARVQHALKDLLEKRDTAGKETLCGTNKKIEKCTEILQKMSRTLEFSKTKSSTKSGVFLRAMYGVKAVTAFICGVILSTLGESADSLISLNVCTDLLWSSAFLSLQKSVHEEIKSSLGQKKGNLTTLVEIQELYAQAESLQSMFTKEESDTYQSGTQTYLEIQEAIKVLHHKVEILSQGLSNLTKQVNEFFQVILSGRNALLDSLRSSQQSPTSIL
eukprot:TRINITY_DN2495_c0_g1_i1.p1 TRINITY_DN2495_c0_g1~~TRINITY_DN2495_c0_g1_i1.p1  ORF type:complete len:366 (-),score=46.67 TRINITY_DN2495_c0_g1_i1:573-1670(-)